MLHNIKRTVENRYHEMDMQQALDLLHELREEFPRLVFRLGNYTHSDGTPYSTIGIWINETCVMALSNEFEASLLRGFAEACLAG